MTTTTDNRTLDARWQAIHEAILAGPNADVQELIDSGLAWFLEGHVGRVCSDALHDGAAVLPDQRVRDYYGSTIPSYRDVADEPGSPGSVANAERYAEDDT